MIEYGVAYQAGGKGFWSPSKEEAETVARILGGVVIARNNKAIA